ncbi:MAG: ATP-binding protein [Actinobacteria bacterium]|nr:ATP-binding protein [Actinomycetota bacterium]
MTADTSSRRFPPQPESVRDARLFVLEQLGLDPDRCSLLTTALAEVATNAVVHARTPFTVRASRRDGVVHVEVADGSPVLPVPKASTLQSPDHLRAPTGLGLRIVEEISASWGADATPDGKTVWFDVDVHEVPAG